MEYDDLKIRQFKEIVEALGGAECALRFAASKKNGAEIIVPNSPSDLIRVDRSIRPIYPFWVREILYEGLEKVLPAPVEFYAGKLQKWTHDGQKRGVIEGYDVHKHLLSLDMIKHCPDLRSLEEIKKRGPTFFERYFGRKFVLGWRSTARDGENFLRTPCLYVDDDGREDIFWEWLNNDLDFRYITLLHTSWEKK